MSNREFTKEMIQEIKRQWKNIQVHQYSKKFKLKKKILCFSSLKGAKFKTKDKY